jgi:hypothetical protein
VRFVRLGKRGEWWRHFPTNIAVWLALDVPQDLSGNFSRDRKVIAW